MAYAGWQGRDPRQQSRDDVGEAGEIGAVAVVDRGPYVRVVPERVVGLQRQVEIGDLAEEEALDRPFVQVERAGCVGTGPPSGQGAERRGRTPVPVGRSRLHVVDILHPHGDEVLGRVVDQVHDRHPERFGERGTEP